MQQINTDAIVQFALPKGRMFDQIVRLLSDAGIHIRKTERDYRPSLSIEGFSTKILKPRNVISMLAVGARDIGFAGNDWVSETGTELVELLDTKLNPVKLVAAAPREILHDGQLPERKIVVATEYPAIAGRWIAAQNIDASILTTFGATEVFPPEDADCIIDNTATGSTLRANNLQIIDEIMQSSTRLYANPRVMENRDTREKVDALVMLLQSVLEARKRSMIDLNVAKENLEAVLQLLPCMREPTVSPLKNQQWFAVRSAVKRTELVQLIPKLKSAGARDIVTSNPDQIIP